MKVGTDGVLLGSWASVEGRRNALDVGCGSGLIALMLAQRNPLLHITGIDIDEQAAEQARENAMESKWADRIEIVVGDFTNSSLSLRGFFDLIVSNPPFYKENTTCPDGRRDMARHASSLPMDKFMEKSAQLLTEDGILALIVPMEAVQNVVGEATMNRLYLRRRCDIKTTEKKAPKRALLEFGRECRPTLTTTMTLQDGDGKRSKEYENLVRDFYLDRG